jgi:hypothetical protein
MLLSQANMTTVLDRLTSKPNLTAASRCIGASLKLLFVWLKRSATMTDEKFLVRWPDLQAPPIWFHEAVVLARKMHAVVLDSLLRDEITSGVQFPAIHQGQLQYQMDPQFIGWSDADMDMCGYSPTRDRYLRDKKGNALPLMIMEHVPAHLRIRGAASILPAWREKSSVDSNVRITGGVLVLSGSEPAKVPLQAAAHAEPEVIDADYSSVLAAIDPPRSEQRTGSDVGHRKTAEPPRGSRVV